MSRMRQHYRLPVPIDLNEAFMGGRRQPPAATLEPMQGSASAEEPGSYGSRATAVGASSPTRTCPSLSQQHLARLDADVASIVAAEDERAVRVGVHRNAFFDAAGRFDADVLA